MRTYVAVLTVTLIAVFLGCGGDKTATSADTSTRDLTASETIKEQEEPGYPLPKLPPQRPPLKKLVIKDLEIGRGPMARWGDEAAVRYVGVYWKTGKVFTQHWGFPYSFRLDGKTIGPGWQKGIHGMRVGGRRELRTPGALINGTDAAYVVTLDKVQPGGKD